MQIHEQPSDLQVVSVTDVIDEATASAGEVTRVGESLATVLLNYDGEEIQDYNEVVAAVIDMGSHAKNPVKLDIDLKNREVHP